MASTLVNLLINEFSSSFFPSIPSMLKKKTNPKKVSKKLKTSIWGRIVVFLMDQKPHGLPTAQYVPHTTVLGTA